MEVMLIGLALAFGGAVLIAIASERLRRRLRRGESDHSNPRSLWHRIFKGPQG